MENENFSLLLEDLEKAKDKKAIVIVGRFQPPTAGHFKLINEARKQIRENKSLDLYAKPIMVIINGEKTSKDKLVNPLTVEERKFFIENSGKAHGVDILHAKNAFDAFNQVRKHGYEPYMIGAGSDRLQGYLDLLDSKFTNNKGKQQKHIPLPNIKSRHELDDTKDSLEKIKSEGVVKIDQVSGSLARRAAELGYFEEFVKITGFEKNIPAAKKMFRLIKERTKKE
jgi:nicotinamide mononucleotide adenylyltransferase